MAIKNYYVKRSGTEYPINSFEYTKEGNSSVDTTTLSISRTYDSVFSIGDDVSIGYHNDLDVFVEEFSGDITSKEVNEELIMVMESYGGRLNRSEIIAEIYVDKSPEYIIEDVTDNYTTLTYAGTATTGVTIDKFIVRDETAGEVISNIIEKLNWQIRVDSDKNVYFEPSGEQSASVILTVGTNAFMEDTWKTNPNRLINECTVIGDNAVFNTNKTFNASASQTDFVVDYKIVGEVRVTVDGTEVTGGQEGATGTYDYTVDKEQKTIVFESAMTGGEAVIVYYSYEVPVKISASNDDSITNYGRFPKKVTDNTLKTTSDARMLAKKIVRVYGEPVTSGELLVNWGTDIDVGETVQVVDSFNGIDQELVVVGLSMKYPEGTKTVTMGVEEIDILSWNKDLSTRVKNLESKQDNTDVVQKYLPFPESLNVVVKQGRVKTRSVTIGNSWIVGSSTNGLVGTNIATQGGGQQVVGSSGRVTTINTISNYNNIMIERFNFTTYNDTGSTTATWNTTSELCSFTTGQIAQSLDVYKGANITKATLTTEDGTNLTAELSCDGGSNWESITIGTEHTFSNTGGQLRWRLTASDTASTNWVKISYL